MAMRMWTQQETRSLISHYKNYPELWDTTHPDYKCRKKKMETSEKLAEIFNATPAEINRKLHNIRTQFHNERRKLQRMRSEVGARRYHTSTWEYYSSLTFLLNSESSSDMKEVPVASPMFNKSLIAQPSIIIPYPINPNQQTSKLNGTAVPKPEEKVRDPVISELPKPEDDEVTFGNFVASAIRNLRSEVRRRQLKRRIQQAILEIEELDEADQSPPHLSAPDAPNAHSTIQSEKQETGWSSPEIKIEYDDVSL